MTGKQLNTKVIQRFLSETELKELLDRYEGAKMAFGGANRLTNLQLALKPEEKQILVDYFNNISFKELIKKNPDLKSTTIYGKVGRLALRYLYQNGGVK